MRLIHSDLCRPMQTVTSSGNKYFLILIDDYSCFTVIRLLKSKDKVPNKRICRRDINKVWQETYGYTYRQRRRIHFIRTKELL